MFSIDPKLFVKQNEQRRIILTRTPKRRSTIYPKLLIFNLNYNSTKFLFQVECRMQNAEVRVARSKKIKKGQNWPKAVSKKAKFSKMKKGKIKANFFSKKLVVIARLKFKISLNILNFAQICPKQASKCTIFFKIKKRPKIGKKAKNWPNGQTI